MEAICSRRFVMCTSSKKSLSSRTSLEHGEALGGKKKPKTKQDLQTLERSDPAAARTCSHLVF